MSPILKYQSLSMMFLLITGSARAQETISKNVTDGPYIFYSRGSRIAKTVKGNSIVSSNDIKEVSVSFADHPDWAFNVKLKPVLTNEPCVYPAPEKIFAVSDIEGEFEAFRNLLLANHIIDKEYRWLFGKGHLVICGDLFDRGPQVPEYLWLLYKLEQEAVKAGGYVHTILGNHDIMNLSGDLRYVQPKYFESAKAMGLDYMQLYDENTELGRWLRSKNVVEKIGGVLYLHGGISPEVVKAGWSLQQINDSCRPYYATKTSLVPDRVKLLFGESSPFWYRGYFNKPLISDSELDASLVHFGVKQIVVGHTIVAENIGFRFGGKVLALDVDQHKGKHEAARFEKGEWFKVDDKAVKTKFADTVSRRQSKHVILISIDGLRPEFYKDAGWAAPNLRQLMKRGTYADHMLSVFPSYTYPTHTAMLTGAYPARSGIYYNQPKGSKGDWNWFAKDIKSPTLWQLLNKSGLTTAAVEWPVSVSNDITWNIPEIWSDQHPDRITEARKYATPGLIEEVEQHATGKLDQHNMDEESFGMDDNSARMAAYIFKTKRPAFLAVHFAEADGMQHEYGREADSVRLAVQAVDRCIGVILEAVEKSGMKDSTTVIVVGDHGFGTIHTAFRPNMLIKSLPARFAAAGGSCFLYPDAALRKQELAGLVKAVRDSLEALPADKRKLFRIIDREELDKMGADSAAILALSAVPGMVFSASMTPARTVNQGPGTLIQNNLVKGLFFPVSGGHHGYDPNTPEMYTGFMASGAGVEKGKMIREIRAVDIAPLVAALLGIEFHCPDGKLPEGFLMYGK